MVTMRDIAALFNVSVATVSRVLNGQTNPQGHTAQRILRAAREMGYFPNAAARTLKTNRSFNLGILYEDEIHHEYFSLLIESIRTAAEACGYDITFLHRSAKVSYLEYARHRGLDGVIVLQATFDSPEVLQLVSDSLPCVAIDYEYACCSCVVSDHYHGIYQLVKHAAEMGHRKIAYVHGQDGYITAKRVAAFFQACAELGLTVPPGYIQPGAYHDPAAAALATDRLLALDNRPSCILYSDDYSCLGAIARLEKRGVSIPRDIAIAGYDGIMLSTVLRPRLTSYRQDVQTKGKEAVRLLIESIEAPPHLRKPVLQVVKGELQAGGTC